MNRIMKCFLSVVLLLCSGLAFSQTTKNKCVDDTLGTPKKAVVTQHKSVPVTAAVAAPVTPTPAAPAPQPTPAPITITVQAAPSDPNATNALVLMAETQVDTANTNAHLLVLQAELNLVIEGNNKKLVDAKAAYLHTMGNVSKWKVPLDPVSYIAGAYLGRTQIATSTVMDQGGINNSISNQATGGQGGSASSSSLDVSSNNIQASAGASSSASALSNQSQGQNQAQGQHQTASPSQSQSQIN